MMTYFKTLKTTVCLAALFSANGALADVTAQQVWDDWQANLAIYGEDGVVISEEVVDGGTITVNGLSLKMEDADTSVSADFGMLVFAEQGDGTVSVTMPDSYPVVIESEGESLTLTVSQSGMEIIVSGDPTTMVYDISADRYAFALAEITEDGAPVALGEALIAINNMQGQYSIQNADMRNIAYDITAGSVDMLMDVVEPEGDGTIVISGKLNDLRTTSQGTMPLDMTELEPDDIFSAGLALDSEMAFSGASFLFDTDVDGTAATGTVALGEGGFDVFMDGKAVAYDIGFSNVAVDVQSTDLPFPVQVSLSEYAVGIASPLGATDDPADFSFLLNLSDLTVNDEIWALGDPGEILPRDPATIKLDLSGQAKLFFDILDPNQADAMARAAVPGELNALNLNELLLSVGGAMVTGSGAFTFDNSDLESFDGLPKPLGDATLQVTGANGLIDNLVAMGLLPADQASMGRMMMGMFARVTGDDQLETKVEVNDQGHLIVNGQRMR